MGTQRISYLALVSALFIACGKDESGGDDDDDTSTVTTNTATSSPSNTTSPNTTTSPNNAATTGSPTSTSGSPGGSGGTGGSDASGGSGGTMNLGGSAGDQGNVGGGAGAPGGSGGTVVIEEDCGYEACGGDLADTDWSYSRLCVERDALLGGIEALCENVELISSNGEVTGTIGFGTDTYDQDASFSVTGEFQIPAECNLLGCGVVELALTNAGGFSDASCSDSGGGCLCSATLEGSATASGGDYATDGDNLTLQDAEGTYCASGDSFKYTGVIQEVEFVYETVPQ